MKSVGFIVKKFRWSKRDDLVVKSSMPAGPWLFMPLVPAVGRQRQVDPLVLVSGPAWSTGRVAGQPGLHKDTLSQETKTNTNTSLLRQSLTM